MPQVRTGWLAALLPLALMSMGAAAPAEGAEPANPWVMAAVGLVMVGTFVLIAFELLDKTAAALLGGLLAVVLGLSLHVYGGPHPYETVHHFIEHDMSVLGVIIGTSILVAIAGDSGLFHFVAVRLVKLTAGHPVKLLVAIMAATVGFVTFLTIAPAALIMASLVLVISKALDDDPVPYMIAVAIAANSGGLMTFASGIPTLMIGTSAGIPYVQFLQVSLPLALLSTLPAFLVVRLVYRKQLSAAPERLAERKAKVEGFDEWALVEDRRLFNRSALILLATIVGFATAQTLGVGLDFIALSGGTAAILFSGFDVERAIKKVKWPVIMFFVGLFVLIGTVKQTGLLGLIAGQIYAVSGNDVVIAVVLLVPLAALLSGVVDNIPVAATMIPLVKEMIAKGLMAEPLWWGLIAACNLGGNPTPVGSISAVIALSALQKERGIKIGWGAYMKVGMSVTALQVVLTIGYILGLLEFGLFPELGGPQ